MKLSTLLPHLIAPKDVEITGISSNSKDINPGYVFFAIRGINVNGENFIDDAIAQGAKAIVSEKTSGIYKDCVMLHSDNVRRDLSLACAQFFAPLPQKIAGVTGTSGKTSSAKFVYDMYKILGEPVGYTGTIGTYYNDKIIDGLTTPEPFELFPLLQDMKSKGIDKVVMEISSQGLDQYRPDGLDIKVAAFTNLSRDHIDYHKTMENYLVSKTRLFSEVMNPQGIAVINADVAEGKHIEQVCKSRHLTTWTFGEKGKELKLLKLGRHADGLDLDLEILGKKYSLQTKLVGDFMAYNLLTSLGMILALEEGKNVERIIEVAGKVHNVAGRLELVATTKAGAKIYVDYAHKPEALEKVIENLRPYTQNNLIVLFGCGGNRDKGKRPIMGKIACDLADKVIVTDDNPRHEDAATIRAEIMAACNEKAINVGDRRTAIKLGASMLQAGDVLLLAGKGHEDYQKIGDETLHFSDKEEALNALQSS
jgi:UDP-N-acetylmuramoyl-L-alanyl-D-glutamate--2,6-diaminopimelate ligase